MDRRQFAVGVAGAGLVLSGCEPEKLILSDAIKDDIKSLDTAIDDLEAKVGDFDDENWRDVVPDVKVATDDVRSAFDKIKQALGIE